MGPEEFLERNGHLASIDEARKVRVKGYAWNLFKAAADLCSYRDIHFSQDAINEMIKCRDLLDKRLGELK